MEANMGVYQRSMQEGEAPPKKQLWTIIVSVKFIVTKLYLKA